MSPVRPNIDRRSFLKSTSLALAATATVSAKAAEAAATTAAATSAAAEPQDAPASPVACVNILQGTNSSGTFSRGNTLPISTRPFGMAHWTLESRANTSWMFAPNDRRLQGFRSTHQLSPWLGDYGQATFMPVCGEFNPESGSRSSSWRPEDAQLSPYSMKLRLMRYSIDTELIATERCCVIASTYTKPDPAGFIFDVPGDKGTPQVEQNAAGRTIRFTSTANEGGVQPGFACYYVMRFSAPWKSVEMKTPHNHHVGVMLFDPSVRHLEVRIGTSFISFEQAEHNLELEVGARSADDLRAEGESVWNKHLSTVVINGATPTQQRTFYSCLYRTLLFPRVWHEPDPANPTAVHHRSPYNGQVVPGVMYADHGYWDVYRAWYPMMTLFFPERLGEILQGWVNIYKEGGWLPQFPCPGYRACMTGSLIDSVFGEAAAKGITGFDMAAAYEGLHKHSTQKGNPDAGYGRRGILDYLQYGYVPTEKVGQAVAETSDAAYGDYCIAQVAKALGKDADYKMYMKRSENWRHIYDPKTTFLRAKKSDGSFTEPFDQFRWGGPYVEGSAWQHRWDVPHDLPALIAAIGGPDKAIATLDQMCTMEPTFNVGDYGGEIHEMSEMAAVKFGQYAHSNQPVHHVLYVYTVAGRPDLAAKWAHKTMEELYTPDTFAGDEDTGSMAAWYILSSLGFFPVCPAKPEYAIGHPLFPSATVRLPGNKTLTVEASPLANAKGKTTLNGKSVDNNMIPHTDLTAGGKLHFA